MGSRRNMPRRAFRRSRNRRSQTAEPPQAAALRAGFAADMQSQKPKDPPCGGSNGQE